jgi:hypothetical protein
MLEIIGTKPSSPGDALKGGKEAVNGLRQDKMVSATEYFRPVVF